MVRKTPGSGGGMCEHSSQVDVPDALLKFCIE